MPRFLFLGRYPAMLLLSSLLFVVGLCVVLTFAWLCFSFMQGAGPRIVSIAVSMFPDQAAKNAAQVSENLASQVFFTLMQVYKPCAKAGFRPLTATEMSLLQRAFQYDLKRQMFRERYTHRKAMMSNSELREEAAACFVRVVSPLFPDDAITRLLEHANIIVQMESYSGSEPGLREWSLGMPIEAPQPSVADDALPAVSLSGLPPKSS